MKTIKFDLKLSKGITLMRLDDLEENLSPELFTHFHSGKLAKWLKVRKLDELAEKMEALRAQNIEDKNELDVKLFKNLCEIFVSEVSEEEAREAVNDYKTSAPTVENTNDEEVEQLKTEIEALKAEIEQLKNPPKPKETIVENFIIHNDGTVTDTKTGLMWRQQEETQRFTWDKAKQYAKTSNFADYSDWRLPTLDELNSLIDKKYKPTINPLAFPNTSEDCFWSSSPTNASSSDCALYVVFSYGFSDFYVKSSNVCVRLVRG
ncbi:MAG: DUF1566 domain-containing protein [Methylococcaceae bacterium]